MTCDFFTEKVFLNEKGCGTLEFHSKRQVICWIENHIKKIDNYIEH